MSVPVKRAFRRAGLRIELQLRAAARGADARDPLGQLAQQAAAESQGTGHAAAPGFIDNGLVARAAQFDQSHGVSPGRPAREGGPMASGAALFQRQLPDLLLPVAA